MLDLLVAVRPAERFGICVTLSESKELFLWELMLLC